MKTIVFTFCFSLYSVISFSQAWTYKHGGNAFDGEYKTSSIIGVGYEFPYKNPLFVINVFNGEVTKPNIYLSMVPSGICDNNRVLIKFDDKDKIYQPRVTISNDSDNWFLNFSVTAMAEVKDSIKKTINYYLLPTDNTLKIRSRPNANSGTIDELIRKDTI